MLARLALAVSVAGLALMPGCVTPPSKEELAAINYGPPPIEYEAAIRAHFEDVLFDPYSAQYVFSSPRQFWIKEAPLAGGRLFSGWLVTVGINAKNRMGGYVGRKYYGVVFSNGAIIRILDDFELRNMRQL